MATVQLVKVDPYTERVVTTLVLNRAQERRADEMIPGDFLTGFTYEVDFGTVADILCCDVGDVADFDWSIEIV